MSEGLAGASWTALRVFIAVHRAGSITSAAHDLDMAQASVSGQIRALEQQLGYQITLSGGAALVDGKRVAGFTNDEEAAAGLTDVVPFLLADALTAKGAKHLPAANFTENVVSDQRVITGQNPQSAAGVARAVVAELG